MTKSIIACPIFSIQSRVINGHITDSIWLKNYVCEIKKCSFNSFQKKIPFLAHFRLRRLYPDPFSQPLGIGTHTVFLSFFLSLIWKTQANRCTKRMLNNHLGPKQLSRTGGHFSCLVFNLVSSSFFFVLLNRFSSVQFSFIFKSDWGPDP